MKIGQEILEEFKKGKRPKDLVAEGRNKTSVYKYWKIYQEYEELVNRLWRIMYLSA